MADKILNTRLRLKYDTLANWSAANPVLLKGEVGIVSVPLASETTVGQVVKPAILFKVGDGTTDFNTLPFASGMAADVHAWAKEATGRAEDIQVFDESNAFIGKTVTEALAQLNSEIGALTGGGESGSISQMINEAINALDVTDSAEEGKYVSAITQENGKIKVVRASLPDYSNVYASKSIENDVATIKSDYLKTADKTELTTAINSKTTLDEVAKQGYAKTTDVNTALEDKVDKIDGYSLVSDTEIARLASVNNYNDTEVRGLISDNTAAITAIKEGATASTLKELEDSIAGVKATADAAAVKSEVDTALAGKQNTIVWKNNDYDAENNKAVTANDLSAAVAGLSGAMHFEGVKDSIPADNTGYESGDVILVENKEYVFDGTTWHELGDESIYAVKGSIKNVDIADDAAIAQSKIAGLSDRLSGIDAAIETAKSDANDYTDNAIATEVNNRNTAISAAVAALDSSVTATAEADNQVRVLTGITQEDGKLTNKTEVKLAAIAKTGNVNDLVQTEGDVLVLFGGNAAGWTE